MKYIFIDIDGTLIGSVDHIVPDSALEALELAKANGHKLFLCTGRPISQARQFYTDHFEGLICSSGGYIELGEKLFYELLMDQKDIEDLIRIFDNQNVGYILEGEKTNYCSKLGVKSFVELVQSFEETICEEDIIRQLNLVEIDQSVNDKIYKISFYTKDESVIQEILNLTEDKYEVAYTIKKPDTMIEVEIFYKGSTKAEGVRKVVSHYGSTLEDTVAFGDSMNDIHMIEACGLGVAMGNACDALKEIANHVTTPIDEDGLYNGFKALELI